MRTTILALTTATALGAAALPAFAWEQLDLGTNSFGQPTYAPEGQGTGKLQFEGLPGVQLNRGGTQTADNGCNESRVYSENIRDLGAVSTMTECNFGKFSLKTYRSSGSTGASGYNPFPVPGPLKQDGLPPGSGGFAPRQNW
jgi:hypothetical protein